MASGPVFMFCAPGLFFGGSEGAVSRFHVLCYKTPFRRYIGRRVPFSCFALLNSFSAIRRVPSPVIMFCTTRLIFGGIEGIGSYFNVLRARTHFRLYQGCRVSFSCFVPPDSFSAVPRASVPIFMFCAPGLVSHGTEGVGSRFQVLRSQTHFQPYRGRRHLFSLPGLVSHGTEGVGSRFRQHRGLSVPFSCFALPDLFLAERMASGLVFIFTAPRLFFNGTESAGSRFHVLRSRTHFRRYRGRQVPCSYFARPDSFSAVPRASSPVIMFCAPGHIFGGTDGGGSRFHILRVRTRFPRCRGR
jgi:hypothetical protein